MIAGQFVENGTGCESTDAGQQKEKKNNLLLQIVCLKKILIPVFSGKVKCLLIFLKVKG